ncbi:hypothetical protein [Geopseudomonas aromaticivorans]
MSVIITYPKTERLKGRLDAACGLIQKAHAAELIDQATSDELHKQALCYAGLLLDVIDGRADTDSDEVQAMYQSVDNFCTLIEGELVGVAA